MLHPNILELKLYLFNTYNIQEGALGIVFRPQNRGLG